MNKVKAFFAKVGNYIKNSAWIQPILIVVVIFVVLFSLNPYPFSPNVNYLLGGGVYAY